MVEETVWAGVSCVAQVQFAVAAVPHSVTTAVMCGMAILAAMSDCFLC